MIMKCMKVQTKWFTRGSAILDFKSEFEKPMRELLPILSSCDDGCPNTHYGKVVHETGESNVPRKGHSMLFH